MRVKTLRALVRSEDASQADAIIAAVQAHYSRPERATVAREARKNHRAEIRAAGPVHSGESVMGATLKARRVVIPVDDRIVRNRERAAAREARIIAAERASAHAMIAAERETQEAIRCAESLAARERGRASMYAERRRAGMIGRGGK